MSVDDQVIEVPGEVSAAERIWREKELSGGYLFAPGIRIHPPSKRTADNIAAMFDDTPADEFTEADVMLVLKALMGDQYEAVYEFLEDFPVEGYPELFEDLFENLLLLVPQIRDMDKFMESAEAKWRRARPDLFDADGPIVKGKKK